MKKGCLIVLALVLFIPVFTYAGNTVHLSGQKRSSTVSSSLLLHSTQDSPIDILSVQHFCDVTVTLNSNNKNTPCNQVFTPAICSALGLCSCFATEAGCIQHKRYLAYIYPSHNFW